MSSPNPDNPQITMEMTFEKDGEDHLVTVVLEFHFSDNAEEHLDVTRFVNGAASALMS